MADVQLPDLGIAATGADGLVVDAVPGVDLEPQRRRLTPQLSASRSEVASGRALLAIAGLAVGAGVQFHHRRADVERRRHLVTIRLDEQRDADAGVGQAATSGATTVVAADDVEAALGGALLAPLRHQAGGMRPVSRAMASISAVAAISKFSGGRRGRVCRAGDIGVRDVAAVLAQVGGDAVRARLRSRARRRARGSG